MTGRIVPIDGAGHNEVRLLLPWYVTGALTAAESAAIEAHLEQCADCRGEATVEMALADVAQDAPGGAGLDAGRGWEAMRRALDADRAPARRPSRRMAEWLGRVRNVRSQVWMGWALAAQACLLLAFGGALLVRDDRPADYRVLGAESSTVPTAGNVLVVFRPETSERELRSLIRASGGRLVDGPTDADAYILAVPREGRAASLKLLRAGPRVVLAEPIDGEPVDSGAGR